MDRRRNERAEETRDREKIRRPAASSGMITTCENPGVNSPGIELDSFVVSYTLSYSKTERPYWGRGRLLASHIGEPGSITGEVTLGFLHVGSVPDYAAGRWGVFSEISRFPRSCIPALLKKSLHSQRLSRPRSYKKLDNSSREEPYVVGQAVGTETHYWWNMAVGGPPAAWVSRLSLGDERAPSSRLAYKGEHKLNHRIYEDGFITLCRPPVALSIGVPPDGVREVLGSNPSRRAPRDNGGAAGREHTGGNGRGGALWKCVARWRVKKKKGGGGGGPALRHFQSLSVAGAGERTPTPLQLGENCNAPAPAGCCAGRRLAVKLHFVKLCFHVAGEQPECRNIAGRASDKLEVTTHDYTFELMLCFLSSRGLQKIPRLCRIPVLITPLLSSIPAVAHFHLARRPPAPPEAPVGSTRQENVYLGHDFHMPAQPIQFRIEFRTTMVQPGFSHRVVVACRSDPRGGESDWGRTSCQMMKQMSLRPAQRGLKTSPRPIDPFGSTSFQQEVWEKWGTLLGCPHANKTVENHTWQFQMFLYYALVIQYACELKQRGAKVAEQLACSPRTKAIRVQSPARIFACGNRAGQCRWSEGFPPPRPFIPALFHNHLDHHRPHRLSRPRSVSTCNTVRIFESTGAYLQQLNQHGTAHRRNCQQNKCQVPGSDITRRRRRRLAKLHPCMRRAITAPLCAAPTRRRLRRYRLFTVKGVGGVVYCELDVIANYSNQEIAHKHLMYELAECNAAEGVCLYAGRLLGRHLPDMNTFKRLHGSLRDTYTLKKDNECQDVANLLRGQCWVHAHKTKIGVRDRQPRPRCDIIRPELTCWGGRRAAARECSYSEAVGQDTTVTSTVLSEARRPVCRPPPTDSVCFTLGRSRCQKAQGEGPPRRDQLVDAQPMTFTDRRPVESRRLGARALQPYNLLPQTPSGRETLPTKVERIPFVAVINNYNQPLNKDVRIVTGEANANKLLLFSSTIWYVVDKGVRRRLRIRPAAMLLCHPSAILEPATVKIGAQREQKERRSNHLRQEHRHKRIRKARPPAARGDTGTQPWELEPDCRGASRGKQSYGTFTFNSHRRGPGRHHTLQMSTASKGVRGLNVAHGTRSREQCSRDNPRLPLHALITSARSTLRRAEPSRVVLAHLGCSPRILHTACTAC
ncbi:hypothetical protein PR048_029120 [Dryococelus australis]|uniref:Uncharacterized protein n=1 Tax=Dryococelus australis TaxID=614101 RepID=A0ABQ9GCU3_9NEOP|nr:hypothetical protein PR048_029120 [Dryococelus australis]